MAEKHKLRQSLAEALDIPAEVALSSARIVISGDSELRVENHKGIVEYQPGKIVLKTSTGQAEILGERLTLAELKPETLAITGLILSLNLLRED